MFFEAPNDVLGVDFMFSFDTTNEMQQRLTLTSTC